MNHRLLQTAILIAAVSVSLVFAQGPAPPTNLHLAPRAASTGLCGSAPSIGRAHEYFNRVKALPECAGAWSLRDQAQLDALVPTPPSHSFQYVYGNDVLYRGARLLNGHTPKDAARLYHDNTRDGPGYDPLDPWPWHQPKNIPRDQVLLFRINRNTPGDTILVITDVWFGPEWRFNRTEYSREYKPFRFITSGSDTLFSAHQVGNGSGDTSKIGQLKGLLAADDYSGSDRPAGLVGKDPISPTGAGALPLRGYQLPHGIWTRHIFELRLYQPPEAFTEWNETYGVTVQPNIKDPKGRWHMVSSWIATEGHDPVRIHYKIPWFTDKGSNIDYFAYNFHTSMDLPNQSGPIIAYARNTLFLLNYKLPARPEQDTLIFQRPLP